MKIVTTIVGCLFSVLFVKAQTVNLEWAKTIGGTDVEIAYAITVDQAGNIYTTGAFSGTVDFDPGPNQTNLISAGASDIFVCKLNANGNLVWAKGLGGTSSEEGHGIAVDANGNVYTTGFFNQTADFDPGPNQSNLSVVGPSNDIFISKLDAAGNYVWAKNIGNFGSDVGSGIAIDLIGNIFLTGYFNGTVDFDPGPNINNLNGNGGRDIFVCKINDSGNLVWAKGMGGSNGDEGLAIALDTTGNVFTTGYYSGSGDFNPDNGVFTLSTNSIEAIFISKLNAAGNFVWAKNIDGGSFNRGSGICTDLDPNTGIANLVAAAKDIFVSKLDSVGNYILAKSFGGTGSEMSGGIKIDEAGNIYTTGTYLGTADFDPNASVFNLVSPIRDAYISKLDASGNLVWAESCSGTGLSGSEGNAITIDTNQNIYNAGLYFGTVDFDPNTGNDNHISVGLQDAFVKKINEIPLQILNTKLEKQLLLFPNPNNGRFILNSNQSGAFEISIMNCLGAKVHQQWCIGITTEINLKLKQGIYFLSIAGDKTSKPLKFIVE